MSHPSSPPRLGLAPGSALRSLENVKIAAYSSLAKESGCRFVPFAFESFGVLGSAGVAFLRDLESYARESFLPFAYDPCLSTLAVLLQKGNACFLRVW